MFDPDWLLELNFYCDTYGICTITYGTLAAFIMECYQRGILNLERTGGLDLTWGNAEADLEMMHQMARGEGFGRIAGQGVKKMKETLHRQRLGRPAADQDIGMESKGLEYSQYLSKESLAQQGGYALTNKGPQHDEAWVIFMDMVNKQLPTFEDKAEALYYFPLFRTWFGLNGFCKLPWNDVAPADNASTSEPAKIPEHVQNYLDLFTATTGIQIDRETMLMQSARVYNFQRIFNIRMGKGLRAQRHPAVPLGGAGHPGGVRVPCRALRQADARGDRGRPGRQGHRREDRHHPRVPHGPLQQAVRRGLPPARLDPGRRAHHGPPEGTGPGRASRGGGDRAGARRLSMIQVNGDPLAWTPGLTVRGVLQAKKYNFPMLIVTIDGRRVERADYDSEAIPDGAVVQVIHLLSGG